MHASKPSTCNHIPDYIYRMLQEPTVSVLGKDPDRKHRINANSFQQNVITSLNGWQYVAFYTDAPERLAGVCYVNLARRQIASPEEGQWETLTFEDEQTTDDGHNTISIGVCSGDGTIHLAFDHHCDHLKFKISMPGAALKASQVVWETSIFTMTQNSLPGIPPNDLMKEVTYPRFVNAGDALLLTYRIGQAGLGSDILYRYSSATKAYSYLGQHLTGVSNSPYVNGIDYRLSRLHISWCYRNFISFDATSTPDAHKQQAGPNGPENNYDLNYAYSDDLGDTWKGSSGEVLATPRGDGVTSIEPNAKGMRVFEIPMGSGILNQEAQAADWGGGFWVLNRENGSGEEKWMVYYRDPKGKWIKTAVQTSSPPTETGSRGNLCVDKRNNIYLILPGNSDFSLRILRGRWQDCALKFETIWRSEGGFDGEPLLDVQRLETSGILSIFTRTDSKENGRGDVVVLDFILPGEDGREID